MYSNTFTALYYTVSQIDYSNKIMEHMLQYEILTFIIWIILHVLVDVYLMCCNVFSALHSVILQIDYGYKTLEHVLHFPVFAVIV